MSSYFFLTSFLSSFYFDSYQKILTSIEPNLIPFFLISSFCLIGFSELAESTSVNNDKEALPITSLSFPSYKTALSSNTVN